MKKIMWLKTFGFLLVLLCLNTVSAQEARHSMGYSITKSSNGTMKLVISTYTTYKGLWLGVSLYPVQRDRTGHNVKHLVFPTKQGRWIKEILIPASFENGTFEAALWSEKIPKEKCSEEDTLCQQLGFRLKGMISYCWGYLSVQ